MLFCGILFFDVNVLNTRCDPIALRFSDSRNTSSIVLGGCRLGLADVVFAPSVCLVLAGLLWVCLFSFSLLFLLLLNSVVQLLISTHKLRVLLVVPVYIFQKI